MNNLGGTQFINGSHANDGDAPTSKILAHVYQALVDKNYNPVNQLVGYIMSGDPTYITSHNGARALISKIDRDELLEEIVTQYIKTIR